MRKIGDTVSVFGNKGKVVGIIENGSGDVYKTDLLEVELEDGSIHRYAESILDDFVAPIVEVDEGIPISNLVDEVDEEVEKSNPDEAFRSTRSYKLVKILQKVDKIFEFFDIKANELTPEAQEEAAFKLFSYIVYNSEYDESIMNEKADEIYTSMLDMEIDDIYRCLCIRRSVCTSDAASLAFLLRKINIESTHITIADKKTDEGVHEVVKLKLNDKWYICDPTLTRTYLQEGIIPQLDKSVFLFDPNAFFSDLYPNKEIKWEHEPI